MLLGDLVLYGEDVGELAVVAFGPEMAAGGDVVELRGDADAVAAPCGRCPRRHSARRAPRRPAAGAPCLPL